MFVNFYGELRTNNYLKIYWLTENLITKLMYCKNWQKHYHKAYKSWSTKIYTGCGRKNTPHLKGHCFSWEEHKVVLSTSSNSGVRAVFATIHVVFGRTTYFSCWGLNLKWWFAGSNRACILHPFALGRRENGPDKETVCRWISNFRKAGQLLESLKEVIRKEVVAIAPEMDLNFMDNYPRV